MDEIQVIHPLINFKGIGIKDGNLHEMEEAIRKRIKRQRDICYECLGGKSVNNKEKHFLYSFFSVYTFSSCRNEIC